MRIFKFSELTIPKYFNLKEQDQVTPKQVLECLALAKELAERWVLQADSNQRWTIIMAEPVDYPNRDLAYLVKAYCDRYGIISVWIDNDGKAFGALT